MCKALCFMCHIVHVVNEVIPVRYKLICRYTPTCTYITPLFCFWSFSNMFLILHFSLFSFLCACFFVSPFYFIFHILLYFSPCVPLALLVSMTYIWNKHNNWKKKNRPNSFVALDGTEHLCASAQEFLLSIFPWRTQGFIMRTGQITSYTSALKTK